MNKEKSTERKRLYEGDKEQNTREATKRRKLFEKKRNISEI